MGVMKLSIGILLIAYGAFLAAIGVIGFLSNPEKAKTALISGGTFGGLSAAWGVLHLRGVRWARAAAIATTALLAVVFVWRSTAGWMAVAAGQSEKKTAAILISIMLAGTAAMLAVLLVRKREGSAPRGPAS